MRLLGEPGRAWIALLIGILAVSAQTTSSIAVSVLMKAIVDDFGWTRSAFASTATVRIVAMVVAMPLAGRLTDRVGARAVLSAGALLVGACIVAIARIGSLPQFWAVSVAMGPGQAFIGAVAANTLVLRLFRRHRGLAIGILNGGDNLLNAGVPILTAALLAQQGWRATLTTFGGLYLALAVLAAVTLRREDGREDDTDGGAEPRTVAAWLRAEPRLWRVLAVFAAVYAYITSLQLHFHAYQTDTGQPPDVAARLLSVQILVGALGAPLFGWLAERTRATTALVVCVSGLAVSAGLVAFLRGPTALMAWAVFHGVVNSGVVALLALVTAEIAGGTAGIGRVLGLVLAVCMGTTVLGNQWTAWVFDHYRTYVPAWWVYTGLLAATVPAVVRLRRVAA